MQIEYYKETLRGDDTLDYQWLTTKKYNDYLPKVGDSVVYDNGKKPQLKKDLTVYKVKEILYFICDGVIKIYIS